MSEPGYRLLDCGDRALTVELGRAVDPVVNAQVVALDEAIRGAGRPASWRRCRPIARSSSSTIPTCCPGPTSLR